MINIPPNTRMTRQKGFATLAITVVVLLSITIITFFVAQSVITDQKVTTGVYHSQQAFDAAQAGLDYGVVYLEENRSTVTDGMVVNGSLANGSSYSITYEFQGGTNDLVRIISVGTSSDSTATRTVEQLVQYIGPSVGAATLPVTAQTGFTLNNSTITNLEAGNTVITGAATVSIIGLGETVLASGTSSTSSSIEADITVNDGTLAAKTAAQMALDALGMSVTSLAATASITATNSVTTVYNTLIGGVTGTTIHITQTGGTARITSGTTIGASGSPVNIVITGGGSLELSGASVIYGNIISDGPISISGNSQVYGLVFSVADSGADISMTGGAQVNGAVVSSGDVSLSASSNITYDSTALNNALNALSGYGKVSGSWKDITP